MSYLIENMVRKSVNLSMAFLSSKKQVCEEVLECEQNVNKHKRTSCSVKQGEHDRRK